METSVKFRILGFEVINSLSAPLEGSRRRYKDVGQAAGFFWPLGAPKEVTRTSRSFCI